MADAKECDRCGDFYKSAFTDPDVTIALDDSRTTSPGADYEIGDLCSDCQHELEQWFENGGSD